MAAIKNSPPTPEPPLGDEGREVFDVSLSFFSLPLLTIIGFSAYSTFLFYLLLSHGSLIDYEEPPRAHTQKKIIIIIERW